MIIVTALTALLAGCGGSDPGRIEIKGETFDLTIAADDASRTRGLGGVAEIPEHGGMIFAFRSAQPQGFWMIDCITDMDILYVCLLYTSPSPRDGLLSRMPSSA